MMSTATTVPAPKSSLSPNAGQVQQNLVDNLNAHNVISGYATGIINSVVLLLPNQGSWYKKFNTNLTTAQTHAHEWLNTIGPDFFAVVPNAFYKFGTTFKNAMNDVLTVANNPAEPDGTLSSKQIKLIGELVGAVQITLKRLRGTPGESNLDKSTADATIEGVYTDLTNFLNNIQDDNRNLTSASDGAQYELSIDEGVIKQLKTDITDLNTDIQGLQNLLTLSEIGTGVFIFVAVGAFIFAAVTAGGGAVVAGVVGGAAVVGLGTSIAGDVIFTQKINADLAKIAKDNSLKTAEETQVAGLLGIIKSIDTLSGANTKAQYAVEGLIDTWKALEAKFGDVLSDLSQANSKETLGILEGLYIQDAISDWESLIAFANTIQSIPVQIKVFPQPTK